MLEYVPDREGIRFSDRESGTEDANPFCHDLLMKGSVYELMRRANDNKGCSGAWMGKWMNLIRYV